MTAILFRRAGLPRRDLKGPKVKPILLPRALVAALPQPLSDARFGSLADIATALSDVRFTLGSGHRALRPSTRAAFLRL